jgi:hypothetical protein
MRRLVSAQQLAEVFTSALNAKLSPRRPTITTVAHAGNWKALYPKLQKIFPRAQLPHGARHSVVLCSKEASYLNHTGLAGALQFKESLRRMLRGDPNVVTFDTQKIDCLRSSPECIGNLVPPGQGLILFFRDEIDAVIAAYLGSQKSSLDWRPQTVCPSSVSVIATHLSAAILREEFEFVASRVTDNERDTLNTIKAEVFEDAAPEIEGLFLEGSFGAEKLRTVARRKIVVALLKVTTPGYSLKSGRDPIEFFRETLSEKFVRHQLPVGCLNDVSPNLSFVVKSQKRFSELRLA